jgi:hypothetical protein
VKKTLKKLGGGTDETDFPLAEKSAKASVPCLLSRGCVYDHPGVKKQRPRGNDTLAKVSPAKLKVEPTVQSWTPREDYWDFKLASRRNRKQRLKSPCR